MTKNMKYGIKVGTIILLIWFGTLSLYMPLGLILIALSAIWFWTHKPSVNEETIDADLKATPMEIEQALASHSKEDISSTSIP